MNSLFTSTFMKLALPAMAAIVALFATRRRGISWRDDLGLRRPSLRMLAAWLGAWLAWIVASEALIRVFGLAQAKPWPGYPPVILVMRIVAIGLLGPFTEELVVRGVLLDRLRRTALGPPGAIAITAVGWAAMHYSYGVGSVALIVVDGVILGYSRYKAGSLWVPITMHVVGNLISIAQSLAH